MFIRFMMILSMLRFSRYLISRTSFLSLLLFSIFSWIMSSRLLLARFEIWLKTKLVLSFQQVVTTIERMWRQLCQLKKWRNKFQSWKKIIVVWFNVWFIWRSYSNNMKEMIRSSEQWTDSKRIFRRWIKKKTIEWTFKITCMHRDEMIRKRARFTRWSIKR